MERDDLAVPFEVRIQEFSDRGKQSLEKGAGADLYISLVRKGFPTVSKGMLLQSKRVTPNRKTNFGKLQLQSRTMLRKTSAAYILFYEESGVSAVDATSVITPQSQQPNPIKFTLGELVASGLRCLTGDLNIGRSLEVNLGTSLDAILRKLGARTALEVVIDATE
jgi:hypothetical protein